MYKARFTEHQIITVLKSVEAGRTVKDVCRDAGISGASYYNWKAKFGGMEASDIKKMKVLEDENRRLKQIIDKAPRHDETIGWSVLTRSYRRGDIDPPHYHVEGQLLYATQGVMLVETGERRWVIPPQRALCLPALQEHSYSLLSQTELRTVYFSRSLIAACSRFTKSDDVHVITATALVKGLIAGLFSAGYQEANQRTMALLLMEILSEAEHRVAELPMPQDERLSRAATDLLVNQRRAASVSDLADLATMSERTFSRLFIRDTGFSFRNWKQRARICVSLDLLSSGVPVKPVAYQLGFSCPAAFTAAFRSVIGATPRDFMT